MKTDYLLFILLIALTNCIQQITHYSSYSLDTKDNYFYLSTWSYSSGYAYLYFEDRSYNLNYNSLEVCFTNTNPSSSISSCSFSKVSLYKSSSSSSYDQYLYQISYRSTYYIVVKYSSRTSVSSSARLSVQVADTDIFNIVGAVLSTLAIVGIVIGSLVVLSIIITILCCCCICAKAATPVTYVNPQPIIYTSPAAYPLTATNF